jgi:class 3 adenylate cyclase/tetratricopeptide (TPR) repeat protein
MQCLKCGVENGVGSNFCNGCGENLQAQNSEPQESQTSGIGSGERRQVTAMFADVVDSTPLAERIGEEALYKVMQEVITEMSAAVADHGGTIEKLTGDGLMALFGAPLAVEDAPLNACRAGLDILARIKAKSRSDEAMDETLQIRVGVNSGHAVVGSLGGQLQQEVTALGDAVNVAARLEGLAKPGTMVVGESTYQLVSDFVTAEFAGEHAVKGKTDVQKIWRIDGLNADVSRFSASVRRGLTKLVGRERELETLLNLASEGNLTKARGINIEGDAGLGKSRLIHEFRRRTEEKNIVWLQGNCSETGRNTPFLPFIDVVRSSFRVDEKEGEGALERRLKRGLERLGLNAEDEAPYLLNLLGVKVKGAAFTKENSEITKENSEIAGLRTRELLARLVEERCNVSPVVLHVEDIHWIDAASEALLLRLMEDSRDLPLLAVFTYRSAYTPPWEGSPGSAKIALKPLSANMTEELLRARLGSDDVPAELTRLVAEKAEGNPLFTEEIINYLSERGELGADRAREIGLPVSLENLLMARVDRLGKEAKAWLQVAAVIGRHFDTQTVTEVAGGKGTTTIEELQRMELIRSGARDGEFIFKHALIQDAVYNSLLTDKLVSLHERVAEVLEQRNLHRLGEIAETLAHHYARTPRVEKTVRYMAEAGQKSLMVYSLEDAYLQLRKVVELVEETPNAADDAFFVDVLLSLARALYFRMDMRGITELLTPHISRAEALGDPARLSRLLFEIGYAHVFGGNLEKGYPLLDRADAIGEESGNDLISGYVAMGKMWGEIYFSSHDAATKQVVEQYSEKAERIARAHRDHWLTAKALVGHSMLHTSFGRPDEARRWAQKLFDLTRETNDPRPRTMGLWALSLLEATHFAPAEAETIGREGADYALSVVDQKASRVGLSVGMALLGRYEEATAIFQEDIEFIARRGFTLIDGLPKLFNGLVMMQMGDMAGGEKYITDTMAEAHKMGKSGDIAIGNLLLGEVYTRMALGVDTPPLAEIMRNLPYVLKTAPFAARKARKHLEAALDYTRKLDAPSFTAWALYNVGRLDKKKKRGDSANARFDEARSLAQSVALDPLVEMIDVAAKA